MADEVDTGVIATVDTRCDVYDLTNALPAFKKTPEGYLKGTAIVTNIGVFEYRDASGAIRRELRSPEEVFSPAHIESLKNKPITFKHPSLPVTVDNFKEYAVGMTGSVVQTDPYHVAVDIIITDAVAIDAIQKGTRALSLGYQCLQVKADEGARYLGVPYDYIQKNLLTNHLSIVDKARAGDAAYIRMDSAEAMNIDSSTEEVEMDDKLRTINLDGVDYKAEDKVIDTLKGVNTRADELQTKLDALTADKSALEAERDKQKERADGLATELDALKENHIDASALPELVKNRVALEKTAEKVGVENFDSLSDLELMSAVVKAKAPKANLDGKDAVYVKARYDGIVEDMSAEAEKKADEAIREVKGSRADGVEEISADAKRKAMTDRLRNAHKSK